MFSFGVGFLWHVSTSLTHPELPSMAFVCCQLLKELQPAACPTAACCGMRCACRVQRLHWVMIPNQNNYNNCLCEGNQIKDFRTLGRDHTSWVFSSGNWERLRRCFLCSSLGGIRKRLCLVSASLPSIPPASGFSKKKGLFSALLCRGGRQQQACRFHWVLYLFLRLINPKLRPYQCSGVIARLIDIGGGQQKSEVNGIKRKTSPLSHESCPRRSIVP